ncbi:MULTISPECIES: hypothetical protein [Lactobacillus]|uniref:hypothetical protein n=1 Tax=Lactobacillus TaxID=1578 RepID=UPI001C6A0F98|nr:MULTISPECIES: hypothetical protein [Lactobacillus]MCX8721302.1 hypothetical protein [Lactobacillus sp. B4010]MCX8732965.1 hypothetical protein [Lactobacillus sp. B4015]MCX8735618.1 hypothetical protein [Lactobacillus sp. B4012]
MTKISEAQKRASQKWDSQNKEKKNYIVAKSQAKRFINKFATRQDLKFLSELIEKKLEQ